MKVSNKYVQIKLGDKVITHHNIILNEYLNRIFDSQLDTLHNKCAIESCYIKFDEPLNVNYDSLIYPSEFEMQINISLTEELFKKRTILNKNNIVMNYVFDSSCDFVINNTHYDASVLNDFVNRKIAGIGFGVYNYNRPIFAYLDTSNMNLVINQNEMLSISRVDVFQSDGLIYGYDYPLHLVNDIALKDSEVVDSTDYFSNEHTNAQLYSIGFGNAFGLMEEEYLINDVLKSRGDNSITFNVQRDKIVGIYPSENLNLGFTPLKDNSKYLIFKYRLYRIDNHSNITYLDKYYTMNMLNNDFGDLDIKLKIERL